MGPEATNGDNVVFIVDDDAGVRSALRMLVKSLGLPARPRARAVGTREKSALAD